MRNLVKQKLPRIDSFLSGRQIDLSLVSIQWLVTLFAGVLPSLLLFRIWDVMLIRKLIKICKMLTVDYETFRRDSNKFFFPVFHESIKI